MDFAQGPLPIQLLPSERSFYCSYPWALNTYPTVEELTKYLRDEFRRVNTTTEAWQLAEVMTNIFMFSCAITNEVDDYLAGKQYGFAKLSKFPLGGVAVRVAEKAAAGVRGVQHWRLRELRAWRQKWEGAVSEYLKIFVVARPNTTALRKAETQITNLLEIRLPAKLLARRLRSPAFFHVRELTHFDVLQLGDKFVAAFPDRNSPIVLVGLRTAGSYFGPLLRAYLSANGYTDVKLITTRPRGAQSRSEKVGLAQCASEGRMAVIVDESPFGGSATASAIRMLRKSGYNRIVALLPIHRLFPDWKKGWDKQRISGIVALTLEPEEWHKRKFLAPQAVEVLLREYFQARGYVSAKVIESGVAESFNQYLQKLSCEKVHTRYKQVYEVQLRSTAGNVETRYILAKGVGWGWFAYRAFLLSERLSHFLPPVLGLRNGLLFTEWRPQSNDVANAERAEQLESIAAYVAARVRCLRLESDPSADLLRSNQHTGYEQLVDLLLPAYGSRIARFLKRPGIRRKLADRTCPVPTLIDAKMHPVEWIFDSFLRKTDFEHHGMGKTELEITDPAYDLAEAILHFKLSEGEERSLITSYVEKCSDTRIGERLFLHKLLAGNWSMQQALSNLRDGRLWHRYQEFNRQYLDSFDFLTVQTMRFCSGLCQRPSKVDWRSPIVALDIDGVLDRMVFRKFPSTTSAGIQAISLLHAHNFAVALDTARSIANVKEYCRAYGFVGGVAEYGSAIWDAVSGQERSLVSSQAFDQFGKLKHALRKLPGVFLSDAYEYSIRAYTFNGELTSPLPTMLIQYLISSLGLDQLRFHQTGIDTAVLAKDVDKGKGLLELVSAFGKRDSQIFAIGDSEPDLAMFRVASKCFSPSQIGCRNEAQALGCLIARSPYQLGLLESVCAAVHPDGKRCEHCRSSRNGSYGAEHFFLELLESADEKRLKLVAKAMIDPLALRAFIK